MSRLDRSIHAELTQEAIDKLFEKRIYTVLSFVEADPELLAVTSGLQYSNVLTIRNAILKKFSSKLTTGYDWYNELVCQGAMISTGIDNLDRLLDGGFVTGNIYELCGASGCGKTQMCFTIAVRICAALREHSVLYVDTKNDASAGRIREITQNARRETDEEEESIMNRIKICRITKASRLLELLHGLAKDLSVADGKTMGFRVVIIDSLSSLFFRYLGDDRREGIALLNCLADVLHHIAVEYHMVVLLTNLVTNWTVEVKEGETEWEDQPSQATETPVLGKYWVHVPDTRIQMKRLDNCDKWLLIVLKSTSQPLGKTSHVSVGKGGVS